MNDETKRTAGRIIKCPSCKKTTKFHLSNPWRPFCSERCKTSDIAAWASESYRIAGRPVNEEELTQEIGRGKKEDSDEG